MSDMKVGFYLDVRVGLLLGDVRNGQVLRVADHHHEGVASLEKKVTFQVHETWNKERERKKRKRKKNETERKINKVWEKDTKKVG